MNIWRQSEKNSFSEIIKLCDGLSNNVTQVKLQKVVSIFNKLFQSYNHSLLSNLYEDAFKLYNKDWSKNYAIAVDLFDPSS